MQTIKKIKLLKQMVTANMRHVLPASHQVGIQAAQAAGHQFGVTAWR